MVITKKQKLSVEKEGRSITPRIDVDKALPLIIKEEIEEELLPISELTPNISKLSYRQLKIILKHILIGCKLLVFKKHRRDEEEGEYRKAEILSVRKKAFEEQTEAGGLEFYVHYCEFNKRLDEWVPFNRLDLSHPIEYPKGTKPPTGGVEGSHSLDDLEKTLTNAVQFKTNGKDSPALRKKDQLDGSYWGAPGEEEEKSAKKKELERLRTSGSMTQNIHEISRVKNLNNIVMGKYEVESWYFSPYPPEMAHSDKIYLCEFCLIPLKNITQFGRHRAKCTLKHPPGREIYRSGDISFFELDGRLQKKYCRWLCLLSKLFLDHKTLYYDVDPFLFYVMTQNDAHGCHMIGYFSKEKESLENYNLACILTLPQYQRKGFGRLLIQFSYELSKIEKKVGSPEKPLSDLGLLSYRAFWTDTIIEILLNMKEAEPKSSVSIENLSLITSFTTQDIIHTLFSIGALRYYRNEYVIYLSDTLVESYVKQKNKKSKRVIQPSKIKWQPAVISNQPKYLN